MLNKVLIYCPNTLMAQTLADLLKTLPDISQVTGCHSSQEIMLAHTLYDIVVIDEDVNLYKDFSRENCCLPVLLTDNKDITGEQVFYKPLKFDDFANKLCRLLTEHNQRKESAININNISFIPVQRLLLSADKTKAVNLTEKEAEILLYLYKAKGEKVNKNKMLSDIWGYNENITTHTLQTHIYRLRLKTEKLSGKNLICSTDDGYGVCL